MKWVIHNLLWTGTFIGLLNLVIVIGAETPNYHRNWHEEELFQTCRDIFQSSTRICDPDHLLDVPSHYALDYDIRGMADDDDDDTISMSNSSNSNSKNGTTTALNAITIALKELKTNHHLPIDTSSCENQSNNVVRGKPISMAIVIVPSIILPRNERPAHIASLMRYAWDSSHEECECQLNDILLLISLEDGEPMIEIYTSQDLRHILTIGRKNDIIEGMMPSLNRERYATAIIAAIEDIIRDVDKDQDQDQDQVSGPKLVFMLLLCVVPLLVGVIKMYVYIHKMRRYWEPSLINIEPIKDDGKPLELMKKFNCTCCMICQLDFEDGFEQKMAIEGGRPITLLQCGHPYHTSCIERWCQAGLTNSNLCPVCKAPIIDNDTSNGPSRNGRGLSRNLTSSRNISISPRSESSTTAASFTSLSSFEVAMERYESRRRRRRREHRRRFESQSFTPGRPPLLLSDDVMQPYEVRVQAQSTEASPLISPSSNHNYDYNSRNRRIEAYPALPRPRVGRNFMLREQQYEQQFNWSEYNEIFPDRPRSSETLEFLDRVQSQSYESAAF